MSDVMNCPTCAAVCRILGQDAESLPQLRAFQNTDAQKKIEQLKKSLHHLQETLRTERATTTPNRVMLGFTLLLIHKQGLDSTQPNLQRGAIALVPIICLGMLREGSASSKRQSHIGAAVGSTLG